MLGGAVLAAILACSAPVGFARAQSNAVQLPVDQAQRWCFQDGIPGCHGEWLQLEPAQVQFSSDKCDAVFILPAVAQQNAHGNVTPAIVIVDADPPGAEAAAQRSGNVRVLTGICTIVLEVR
jgi:hypothetical protein